MAEADSPDNLVALCLHNPVHAVIVDVSQLAEIEGWSVAQSVKMVRPSASVILFCHGPIPKPAELPTAVDALVSDTDLTNLLTVIDKHTVEKAAAGG